MCSGFLGRALGNSTRGSVKEAALGRARSWAATQSQQRPQPLPKRYGSGMALQAVPRGLRGTVLKEERLTLELSTANILHSWETEVGHMDSTWCPLWPVQVEMPGSLPIAGLTRVSPNAVGCSFLEFF